MGKRSDLRATLEGLRGDPDALIGIILEQAETIASLERGNAQLSRIVPELTARIQSLETRLEESQREAKRQAAPFRIADKKRKTRPKKPGRPAGHPGARHQPSKPVNEFIDEPLEGCPHCGGPVVDLRAVTQIIEEIPEVQLRVVSLTTYTGHCPQCGPVRSTHPLQASTAQGAAGAHLGPGLQAFTASLRHSLHLTTRKVCRIVHQAFGLQITPGAVVHLGSRLAKRLEPEYDALVQRIRQAAVVYADETSWWVGGKGYWLWVFTGPEGTVYRIHSSRGRDVLFDTLGTDFAGVLSSDCLVTYDGVCEHQSKCFAHHAKAVAQAIESRPGGATPFLQGVRLFLKFLPKLKFLPIGLPPGQWVHLRRQFVEAIEASLRPIRSDPYEERVANRLRKQIDHLLASVDYPEVDSTNNQAERALRPAVISRKLSCGNRTAHGAHVWEIMASLAATCDKRGESFIDLAFGAAQLRPMPP
jgi:transposase